MICGIDEAGRGPLAGPVCAAAVILPACFPVEILGDSKKKTPAERKKIREIIIRDVLTYGLGWASPEEIDKINILQASLLAMKRAWDELAAKLTENDIKHISVIIDGLYAPDISAPCTPMVKADASIPEVMAASIMAKTARDAVMDEYARLYPQYGYEKHKGYPTKTHREAVLKYGHSPIQRMSFKVRV